jgi:septum formation protein
MSLWRAEPLILASKSQVRRRLLEAAGIPVVIDPANIDERGIETAHGNSAPDAVAQLLAREKALAVARQKKGIVLGADQTLALGQRRFSKPVSPEAAGEQLKALAGNTHALHSALALAQDGRIVFETTQTAKMSMRPLSDDFVAAYLKEAGDRVKTSVGAYQLEGLGIHLFEKIEGDHFTVLGMPLPPLLAFFRKQGWVVS